MLVEAPQRVQKLVALSPVPSSGVPFDEQGWGLCSGAAESPANRRASIDLSTRNRLPAVWLDAMVATSLDNSTQPAFAAYLEAWAKGEFHERITGNPVPLQVVVGEHDSPQSAEVMRATWLQWYPNARLEVLANAGHCPMDETPLAAGRLRTTRPYAGRHTMPR